MRIKHRWDAIQQSNDEMENARLEGREYIPLRYESGDTKKELLARSRYLLFKSADKWTDRQKKRARILFELYPDLKEAYSLCHSLRMIFAKNTVKDAARLSMAKWYNKVEEAGFHSFNVIAATFYEHYDDILNFYNNRSSNAAAESFNAKVKAFRAALRGIRDEKFFLYRLAMMYAYPTNYRLSTGITFVDSTMIPVCHNLRRYANKVFAGLATDGKGTMGWRHGFKLHFICNDRGEIIMFCLTGANVDDRDPRVWAVLGKRIYGKLFADRGAHLT